jgi:hypothetical protein
MTLSPSTPERGGTDDDDMLDRCAMAQGAA